MKTQGWKCETGNAGLEYAAEKMHGCKNVEQHSIHHEQYEYWVINGIDLLQTCIGVLLYLFAIAFSTGCVATRGSSDVALDINN